MRPHTKVILTALGAFALFLSLTRDADGLWAISVAGFFTYLLIALIMRDPPDGGGGHGRSAYRDGGAGYDRGGSGSGGFGDGGGDGGE